MNEPINEPIPEVMTDTFTSVLASADRVTARLDLYHEQEDEQTNHFNSIFSEFVSQSGDPVYSRKIKVGEEWVSLDTGWLEESSYILIQNIKKKYRTMPDEEEVACEKKKTVRIRSGNGEGWIIKNGSFFFGNPSEMSKVQIKCEYETTQIEIHIFPK
tara:strand:+ start:962 stop:1435 length:474 start_codon:yes stop_codon:yes gene_type:complete